MILQKINLFFIVLLIALNNLNWPSFAISELKSKLYFSENPITFDLPMIRKNNTDFIPVRSLVKFFDGSIRKSNVTYEFKIDINNKNLIIKPNKLGRILD